ncbi:MAG: M50 family metallopeptidase [Thermoplasmatales archaeon]|nr:M50 family metallopeptidase [Thermoplasmatales archaeon]
MKTSISIGRIMGIPIKLHITFLLILPVFAYFFAFSTVNIMVFTLGFGDAASLTVKCVFGALAAVLFFVCVLFHELGHSYVALRHGTKIKSITLLIFGGIASMEEIPKEPGTECSIALAGPLVSLLIGVLSLMLFFFLYQTTSMLLYVKTLFGILAFYNIFLAGFNFLPAFPMDGGRVLRAFLATKTGYIDATEKAAGVGKIFAIFMGILGFLLLPGGIWFVLIAFIIYIGASEEEKSTVVAVTLEGIKVKDIMTPGVVTVPSAMTASELVDFMLKTKHMGYPVFDESLLGIVTLNDVRKIPVENRINTPVRDIMTKNIISIKSGMGAVDALKIMVKHNIGRLLVIDNNALVGIVSRTDLIRSVQILR